MQETENDRISQIEAEVDELDQVEVENPFDVGDYVHNFNYNLEPPPFPDGFP